MKTKIISATLAMLLCALTLASCGNEAEPAADTNAESGANTEEMVQSEAPVEDGGEGIVSTTSAIRAQPDLHRVLACSKLVISGEVLEAKESYQTNPNGDMINNDGEYVHNYIMTPYLVRVDEVYRGDVKPGDVIVMNGKNSVMPTYDSEIVSCSSDEEDSQYFEVGQKAVFCLTFYDTYFPAGTTLDDVGYMLTLTEDAVFEIEPQNEEQEIAAIDLDEPGDLRYSENFTIDLDTIKDEIDAAAGEAAKYGADEEGNWIGYPDSAL